MSRADKFFGDRPTDAMGIGREAPTRSEIEEHARQERLKANKPLIDDLSRMDAGTLREVHALAHKMRVEQAAQKIANLPDADRQVVLEQLQGLQREKQQNEQKPAHSQDYPHEPGRRR